MKYVTASGAQVVVSATNSLMIQVNTALTGTITVSGAIAGTFAIITNPVAGNRFVYNGLRSAGAITVNPSATTDITISFQDRGY